jgi:N-carbamoyl-L-amino-acid hydrolase
LNPVTDAARVIADLRELDRRTGGSNGAQRLCWGEGWQIAREFLRELLAELSIEPDLDPAGNLWATLEGDSAPGLVLGSHLDSVPNGGWLDGALGVFAGLGVLRAWKEAGTVPPRNLTLVDWADEEGARFGRSLFGSSAFSGSLRTTEIEALVDADGATPGRILAANGVDLDAVGGATEKQPAVGAYLELHIEQGPVLEAIGQSVAAVDGCVGVRRWRFLFVGQPAHAGTTPMDHRRDPGLAAAALALSVEEIANTLGGRGTTGSLRVSPCLATAIPESAELIVDLRHGQLASLEQMLERVQARASALADERGCALEMDPIWAIDPIDFDATLVATAARACRELCDSELVVRSGALHDAAEVARVAPAAMLFSPSRRGLSHTREEDTAEADLLIAVTALAVTANAVLDGWGGIPLRSPGSGS